MASMDELTGQLVGAVQGYVRRCFDAVGVRLKAVETRLDALPPLDQLRGEKGDAGLPGKDGAPGERGERGEKGEPGAAGEPGLVGRQGQEGPQGQRGDTGEPGQKGESGPAGKDGEPGPIGPQGDPGERGEPGSTGERGERGLTGERGEPGLLGERGMPGERGEKGDAGIDGRDGRDGEPGRDALQIDILDGIEPGKRYQRGTFAVWEGGIVRAFRATDPLAEGSLMEKAGWHVVVRGIADVRVEFAEDQRTVTLHLAYTGGPVVTKAMAIPTMIYRGVWREGEVYSRGDSTTRGGSAWVLMVDAQAGKPGDENSGWQLAVKKGTDGRDGLKGEKGDRGAEGRGGRDLTQMGPDGTKW